MVCNRFGIGLLVVVGWVAGHPAFARAETPKASRLAGPDFVQLVPKGSLVIVGGGETPKEAKVFFLGEFKKGKGKLVVIPSASLAAAGKGKADLVREWAKDFSGPETGKEDNSDILILDCKNRQEADAPEVEKMLREARAVWIGGGQQSRLAELYQGTAVEQGLKGVVERGGVVGGTSAGAAILCRTMIASQGSAPDQPKMGQGFDLLPRVIIDQHFKERQRQARLASAMKAHPGWMGLGIDEGTALLVTQRLVKAVGKGYAHCLWSGDGKTVRETVLKPGQGEESRDDLVRLWRVAAHQPPTPRGKPEVGKGALMAVGGGGMPREVVEKFIQLAGGKDAVIVVLPTAGEPMEAARQARQEGAFFKAAGVKDVRVLKGVSRAEVDSEAYAQAIGEASGVWFGGGRQWRFVDAYEGTKTLDAMRGLLARGGVIGGSSAGATILGDYLCRGGPLGNREILVPGYDRGLAFLPGVGIDQHFAQRERFADMEQFIREKPEFLGLGIDEATALVVTGEGAEVLGPGKVHVYRKGSAKKEYASGEKFQLR